MKKNIIILTIIAFMLVPVGSEAAKTDRIKKAFGVNIHLRQRIPEANWDKAMGKATEAGVQWGREQFDWDVIEPSDGTYSWDAYDKIVDKYEEHGIKMVGLLTYSSAWASANPSSPDSEFYPPDMNAWEEFVGKVASRYKGRVDYWEIWNEPNHEGFWKGELADYARLLKRASRAIESNNSNAKVILGGLSGSDADYLDQLYSQLADPTIIDIVAFHPYRVIDGNFNYAPEKVKNGLNSLETDINNIKAIVFKHDKKSTPLWLTEVGWTTYNEGVTDQLQAQYLIRLYTMALAMPNVKKVFWYSLNDTSNNEAFSDAQFGLLNHNFEEKKSFSAYKYVKKRLHRRFIKDRSLPRQKLVDNFSTDTGWAFKGVECTNGNISRTVKGRLKVDYDFYTIGNCYAPVARDIDLPGKTRALQFRLRGDNNSTTLRVRIKDARGETFQYTLGYMPKQWTTYTVQLSGKSDNWGGDEDGLLDRPLSFDSFVLDDKDGEVEDGTIYIDDLIASPAANVYIYRFHKDKNDIYAFWSTKKKKRLQKLYLTGAGKIRIYKFLKSSQVKTSGTAKYKIKANKSTKFIQTL